MSVFRAIGRLFGFKDPEPVPTEAERRWRGALERYRWAEAQVREAATPEELELAHQAWLAAQADLQWLIRLAKRDQGQTLRPVSETHRVYQALLHQLRSDGAASDGGRSSKGRRGRSRVRRRRSG
ncbi:MAG: hypothetical protein ACOY94_13980 [Bacillota bacterium]